MLTRIKKSLLNNNDITILNSKVISIMPIYNPDKNVMIV